MYQILLIVLLFVAIGLVAVILLQRSEGGALGIGGGGPGGMMSARGAANLLTRATAILATLFVVLAMALTILSRSATDDESVIDDASIEAETAATTDTITLPVGEGDETGGEDDTGDGN